MQVDRRDCGQDFGDVAVSGTVGCISTAYPGASLPLVCEASAEELDLRMHIGIADSALLDTTHTAEAMIAQASRHVEVPLVIQHFAVDSDLCSVDISLLVIHGPHCIYGRCGDHTRVHHRWAHIVKERCVVPAVSDQASPSLGASHSAAFGVNEEAEREVEAAEPLEVAHRLTVVELGDSGGTPDKCAGAGG